MVTWKSEIIYTMNFKSPIFEVHCEIYKHHEIFCIKLFTQELEPLD